MWWNSSKADEANAYFQAGHAVFAHRGLINIVCVSINLEQGADSWIEVREPDLTGKYLKASAEARAAAKAIIRSLLAGPAAQSRYRFGTYALENGTRDFNLADPGFFNQAVVWKAISIAGRITEDSPSLIRVLWREVERLVQSSQAWPAVDAVAKSLLLNRELTGHEIGEIVRHAAAER